MNIVQPNLVQVYKCLCDLTRLRILALLLEGPLCVCHIQSILGEPQPKVSRQVNLMKKHGMLESEREFNWSIYRISSSPSPVLASNLSCLQDLRNEIPVFRSDLERRSKIIRELCKTEDCCPSAVVSANPTKVKQKARKRVC